MSKVNHNDEYIMNLNDEIIEQYLRNEMNEEEEKHFYKHIKTHPSFRVRAEVIAALLRSIKRIGKNKLQQ